MDILCVTMRYCLFISLLPVPHLGHFYLLNEVFKVVRGVCFRINDSWDYLFLSYVSLEGQRNNVCLITY